MDLSSRAPRSWVSPYKEPSDKLSVALAQPNAPRLSRQLKLSPTLVASNYEESTFRFETTYYRRGSKKYTLLPRGVDALAYSEYRRKKFVRESFDDLAVGTLRAADEGRSRGGLGVSVDLPKRLDKIFGEGGAGLTVSGYRKIMFSGRSQWTDDAASPIVEQSKFPSLTMEQQYQFDITGTIGSKITVKVNQDSHTDIPLANRIQIRYKGDDDDVLKAVEAGNTNLSLPNTQFVGYSSRINGLFGVKAEAQLGPLYLTGIASQEKGSSERTSITPSGEESARIVRDYEYVDRRIFDLVRPGETQVGDEITQLFVFKELTRSQQDRPGNAAFARLFVNPAFPDSFTTEKLEFTNPEQGVEPIEDDQFDYYSYPDSNSHYIVFNNSQRDLAIGVYMVIERGDGSVDTIGTNSNGSPADPKILKLIYSSVALPAYQTWDLMWRNIYDIPKGITIDDIDIKIYKGDIGTEQSTSPKEYQESAAGTQNFIEILGLDQINQNERRVPDGKLDDLQAVFRPDWGLIIFPHRLPFASDTTYQFDNGTVTDTLVVKVPGIYFYESSTAQTEASKYFMKQFSKSRTNEIRLGRPNIIEGSERVTANGALLQRGTDYRIDYDFGRITLLSDRAQDPNADIDIDFEYAPFLAIQKKTLFGFRAEYEVSRDLQIGSTVLYKSDKAQDRKPRVGQETAKAFVFDVDAAWSLQPNFLTKLANALPIVQTESPSNLRLAGELAQSHPNPNVDGAAYIDDFEASAEQTGLGVNRTNWQISSKPPSSHAGHLDKRSKLLWHNPVELLRIEDVYNLTDDQTEVGQSTIRPLRLVFRPRTEDTTWSWQENPDAPGDTIPVPEITDDTDPESWAGMMRGYSARIDAERVQVLEIRVRANSGIMHLDFGRISEDINGDGAASFETTQGGDFPIEDDVGLDGLADPDEPFYHPVYNPDPNGDNWYFDGAGACPLPSSLCGDENSANDTLFDAANGTYYEWLNGTEGNYVDFENYAEPDEETYGRTFQDQNGYFSYEIDFGSANPAFRLDSTKKESAEIDKPAWYTYRIPIRDSSLLDAVIIDDESDATLTPRWSGTGIQHIRIWFEERPNQTTPDTIEIADWYFVQSNWRDTVIYGDRAGSGDTDSTKFVVASVGEDDGTFEAPPDVDAYEDPTTGVREVQRGLSMEFKNLDSRDTAFARKSILTVDTYSGYRELEMYVYGALGEYEGDVEFYFRLGRDSLNFYEQSRVLRDGWHPDNHIAILFDEITALKNAAQRDREPRQWSEVDTTAGSLRVTGDPSLNEIKYFAAGVRNISQTGARPTGFVWIDELRVTDVRRDVGTAARFTANGNIADLGTYNFSYQSQDPYFRGLSSSTRGGSDQNLGSGRTDTRYSYGLSLNMDRFLPRSWNARVPVQMSYSKNTQTPLLRTGSDIVLPDSLRIEEQSISESRNFSVSASFDRPGKNPLFSLLLNRLDNTSFSYRRSLNQSPRTPYGLSEGYNIRSGFNFGLKEVPTVPIFFWTKWIPIAKKASESRLSLYPRTWRLTGSFDRTLTISDDVDGNRRSSFKRNLDARMDFAYDLFQNLSISLRFDTRRDLSDAESVNLDLGNLKLGLETHYGQSFSAKYDPRFFSWLATDLSYSSSYSDDWERANQTRRSTMSNSWGVSGTFDHIGLLGGRGSGGGERRFRGGFRGGSRSGTRGQKPDESSEDDGRPFYDPPLAVLRFLTGWIQSPSYGYSESFRYSVPGMTGRPRAQYRFGFSRTPDIETVDGSRNPDAGESVTYDLGSGFSLLGGLQTDIKFRRNISRDLIKRGNLYQSTSTSWPELSVRITPFKTLPLIKGIVNKFIDVFSPRTGYSRSTRETEDLRGGFVTSKSTTIQQNPVIALNFKLFRKLQLTSSFARSQENSEEFNRTTGDFQSESESVRKSFGASASYSFAAPSGIKLPLFGRVKFQSQVNISMDFKYNNSINETRDAFGNVISSTEKDETSIQPDISYTFSQSIRGGLSMRWKDSNSNDRRTHLREVSIWMEIRF